MLAGDASLIGVEITTSGDALRLGQAAARDVHPEEVRTATSFVRTTGYQPDYSALTMDANVIFPWGREVFDGDDLVVNPCYEGVIDD